MNQIKAAMLAAALIAGSVLAQEADAHGRRHRGHVGIFFGVPAPVFYPRYYDPYPRYYYPPTVLVPAPVGPPVYIEQPQAAAPSQSSGAYWYYCRDTQTYYPYVQQCASPWEQVTPQGAPPS